MILLISLKKVKKHNFFFKIAIYYKIPYIYNFRRKKYLNNGRPQSPVPPSRPSGSVLSAPKGEAAQTKQFVGKTLDDLNDRGTELEKWLVDNKSTPLAKKIFEALQGAEETGQPIDQKKVLEILQSDGYASTREKLQAAIDEINGCHK